MAIRRDKIIVVDIECTCWRKDPPPDQVSEIIEIGVCAYHLKTGDITQKRGIIVKPVESVVSDFCTQLTTIMQEQVDEQGIPFADACDLLRTEYDTETHLWGSWGNYDRLMFIEQCQRRGVAYPFSENHVNIKKLFAQHHDRRQMGMAQALKFAELELIGTHHRGVDDAYNIARLLNHLLKAAGRDILLPYW